MTSSGWFETTVREVSEEAPGVETLLLELPHVANHLAGQHYEIRLTAENGYQAARLYSAASAASGSKMLELTIQKADMGEVSPYLNGMVSPGDKLEVRGPLGRFFVWNPSDEQPIFLVGGGSGIIPMRAILQAHANSGSKAEIRLLYSAHTYDDILFKDELITSNVTTITITRDAPEDWKGERGRITISLLDRILNSFSKIPACYVCGMNDFVDAAATGLQDIGIPASGIKTERFG